MSKEQLTKETPTTLENKVAVITGGSSGIGLATAHEMRARGNDGGDPPDFN